MPLHLLLGLRTSETPVVALQRRRTSLGMSLKYRHCSFGFQMGPSVNRNPLQSFSTPASLSTSRSNSDDLTPMESPIQPSPLLNITHPKPRPFHYVYDHDNMPIDESTLICKQVCWDVSFDRDIPQHPMGHWSGLSNTFHQCAPAA